MKVAVNLHTHEETASRDSSVSYNQMIKSYEKVLEIPFRVGVVGHDNLPKVDLRLEDIKGIEITKDKKQSLHIVEFEEYNFRILAHPKYTWGENPKKEARKAIRKYNVDAVEKINGGNKQFKGQLPASHIAGDDAHNQLQTASSYIVIETPTPKSLTWEVIFDKIKKGEFEIRTNDNLLRSLIGQTLKSWTIFNTQ